MLGWEQVSVVLAIAGNEETIKITLVTEWLDEELPQGSRDSGSSIGTAINCFASVLISPRRKDAVHVSRGVRPALVI